MISENEWIVCIEEAGSGTGCIIKACANGLGYIATKKNTGYIFLTKDLIGVPYGSCFDMKALEDDDLKNAYENNTMNACASDKYITESLNRGKKRKNNGEETRPPIYTLIRVRGVGVIPPSSETELRETRNELIEQLQKIDKKLNIESSYEIDANVELKTNQYYSDTRDGQKLGMSDVVGLAQAGTDHSTIVNKLAENNQTFDMKTEFGKDKYIEKHTKRWSKRFRVVKAVSQTIAQTLYVPTQFTSFRIGNMRPMDTLPQMLSLSNIQPGSKVLIVENKNGLLEGCVMERLLGEGKLYVGTFDSPYTDMIQYFNFNDEEMSVRQEIDLGLLCSELKADNKEQIFENKKVFINKLIDRLSAKYDSSTSPDEKETCKTQIQSLKRTLSHVPACDPNDESLKARVNAFKDLRENGADSLIIASKFDPVSLFKSLYEYLALSRPFVVFSEDIQELETIRVWLLDKHRAVSTRLGETWYRQYQILPGRTHPEMMTSASGGYLLSGIKVSVDGERSKAHFIKIKK